MAKNQFIEKTISPINIHLLSKVRYGEEVESLMAQKAKSINM